MTLFGLILGVFVLVGAGPAMGTEYPCPSDPGFCYFDAGNDGCFDGGADTGPINADLEAGPYPPVGPPAPGSVVCPPSVKKLVLAGPSSWVTAPGGDVLLFGKKIVSPGPASLTISSGRNVVLGSAMRTHDLTVTATDDISVTGKIVTVPGHLGVPLVTLSASTGNLSVGPKGVFRHGDIRLETPGGGDITFLDRSSVHTKNGPVGVVSGGALTASNLKVSGGQLDLSAQSIDAIGHTKLKTNPGIIDVLAVGSVQFERLTVDGKGDFSEINISGDAVTIGSPGSGGHVRTSRLNVPAELEVDATGDVNLQEFKVRTGRVLVDTAGTMVNVTGSSFSLAKKPGAAPPEVVVTAGAGSTCDLSETTVTNMTLVVSCDTVVGP